MYEAQEQQAYSASKQTISPTPRAAQLFATVGCNIDTLAQLIEQIASRVVGPHDAAANNARGIPVTYCALAEDLAKRTEELIGKLEQIAHEI